jgi:hypothetical protein
MLKNGIDPKWTVYLGMLVAIEQAIGHGTVSLTNLVPADWATYITSWCNFLAFVGTSIMTYQAAVSSSNAGPLIAPIPDLMKPVVKILIAAFVLSMFLAGGSAQAAQRIARVVKPAVCDPLNLIPGCKQAAQTAATATGAASNPSVVSSIDGLLAKLESIQNSVVVNVITDIQAADADAGTVITPAGTTTPAVVNDPISHACYPAAVQFLQSLPIAKATTGTLFGIQLFQKKRDFVNQLKAGLPSYLKIGCGALVGDEVQIFITMMGMVGVTVATGGITGLLPAATLLPAIPALSIP